MCQCSGAWRVSRWRFSTCVPANPYPASFSQLCPVQRLNTFRRSPRAPAAGRQDHPGLGCWGCREVLPGDEQDHPDARDLSARLDLRLPPGQLGRARMPALPVCFSQPSCCGRRWRVRSVPATSSVRLARMPQTRHTRCLEPEAELPRNPWRARHATSVAASHGGPRGGSFQGGRKVSCATAERLYCCGWRRGTTTASADWRRTE